MRRLSALALAAFVFTLAAARSEEGAKPDAKAAYDSKCALCHGKDGKGDTAIGKKTEIKDLTDPKYQASYTDEKAFKDLKEGLKDGDKVKMKAFGDKLTDDEIKALVEYCRSFAKPAEPKAEGAK